MCKGRQHKLLHIGMQNEASEQMSRICLLWFLTGKKKDEEKRYY